MASRDKSADIAPRRDRAGVRWLTLAALGMVTLGLVSCFGCATTIVPPSPVHDPVVVYLADYGRHSSVVLPRDENLLIEYTYGEWQWYALNQTGVFGVVRSLLLPSQGALGRRHIDPDGDEPWWDRLALVNAYELVVERDLADALLAHLDERWENRLDTVLYNPVHDLDFVYDPQIYLFLNNSNPTTARWLRHLGCEIRGPALISDWRIIDPETRSAGGVSTSRP